jgi:hypothetical protein
VCDARPLRKLTDYTAARAYWVPRHVTMAPLAAASIVRHFLADSATIPFPTVGDHIPAVSGERALQVVISSLLLASPTSHDDSKPAMAHLHKTLCRFL